MQKILIGFLLMFNVACSMFGYSGVEETPYKVLLKDGDKEIRQYEPHIVAKTQIKGEYDDAQSEGFRILAGYIFGKNKKEEKIAMTAPVVRKKEDTSQKIAMTAPVVQKATEQGWVMTFMMPSQYKMQDLPTPLDERISFAEVPGKTVAAIRYNWGSSKEKNDKKAAELMTWLEGKKQYSSQSQPYYAGYNPPWTLGPFRRNEMLIEVSDKQ